VLSGLLEITGLTARQIGEAAAAEGLVLHELTPIEASLEEAFMDLTRDTVEFRAEMTLAKFEEEVSA
jgi:ABC-2 type transport system ATP-binding protein